MPPPLPLVDSESPDVSTGKQFFKLFNIKKGVDLMVEAWRAINTATVRHGWKNILQSFEIPSTVTVGERQSQVASVEAVVQAAKAVRINGYDQVSAADVEELIGQTQISVEDNVEDMIAAEEIDAVEEQQEVVARGDLTMAELTDILGCAEILKEKIAESDGTAERREASINHIMQSVEKYRVLHQKKVNARHQTLISQYLARRPPIAPSPPPAVTDSETDDGIEEGAEPILVLGNDFEGFVLEDPSME